MQDIDNVTGLNEAVTGRGGAHGKARQTGKDRQHDDKW
jgi:hypothetical protein